jgi:hypothetical protein
MREMAMGVARLFEVGEAPVTSEGYSHSDPWAPPVRRDEEIEFDREPPPERDEESD